MIREGQSRDVRRYERLRELGCIACHIEGFECLNVEIHHLVDKGYRKHSGGNQATIPLCVWHHKGEPVIGATVTYTRRARGPSMYWEAKEFARRYGSQRELLARVNDMISGGNRLK
jgi:hypothetical protein